MSLTTPTVNNPLSRWILWTIPMSILAGPLAVVLVVVFSTSDSARLGGQISQILSREYLPGLMAAGLLFVPVFGMAILIWVGLVRIKPDLDRSWWALSLGLPAAFLATSASYSLATEGANQMSPLSLPGPLVVGTLALIPRLLDPHLRPGAISPAKPRDAA